MPRCSTAHPPAQRSFAFRGSGAGSAARQLALWSLLVMVLACGTTPTPPNNQVLFGQDSANGDGNGVKDTTAVTDTANQPDTGPKPDTGPLPDTGPKPDAGPVIDSGPQPDVSKKEDGKGEWDGSGGQPDIGTPIGPICKKPSDCFAHPAKPYCKVLDGVCVQCITNFHCPKEGQICMANNTCAETSCVPKAQTCIDSFKSVCNDDGKGWTKTVCPESAPNCIGGECRKCIPDENYCAPPAPGQVSSKLLMKCNGKGTDGDVVLQCGGATVCINGKCGICTAGLKKCDGFKAMVCNPEGSAWEVAQDCALKDLACLGGLCVDPCGADVKSNTNVGCDYWGVDLDNAQVPCGPVLCDAQNMQYSIIISNTKTSNAEVTITTGAGKSAKYQVPGGDMKVINLPDPLWGGAPLNQNGSGINTNSFRIQSTVPIVAYQFNPLENYKVFSNDASLLLPSNVIGKQYFVMSRQQNHNDLRGYLTIVGSSPNKTKVTIIVSAKTLPGAGIPGLNKGQTFKFTLSQGEVFNLETNELGADLTGTWIDAEAPVAVFGGHEGGNVPDTNKCVKAPGQLKGKCEHQGWDCETNADCPITCCADHLEEQLFPLTAWGKEYLATKLKPRGLEKDVYRILAAEDGTIIKTDPPQAAIPELKRGEWYEFESLQDFVISSNKPISVGQFMTSANAPLPNNDTCTAKFSGTKVCEHHLTKLPDANKCVANKCQELSFLSCAVDSDCPVKEPIACSKSADCPNIKEAADAQIGDPAFLLIVPVDRYLIDYVILVPDKYAQNYLNIVAITGSWVKIDGQAVPPQSFKPFGTKQTWSVARVAADPGKRHITAEFGFGLMVYGYDKFVSYGYPGGARVK